MVQMISESKRKIAALALAGAMAIGGAAGVATTIASPAQNQSGIVMEAEAATVEYGQFNYKATNGVDYSGYYVINSRTFIYSGKTITSVKTERWTGSKWVTLASTNDYVSVSGSGPALIVKPKMCTKDGSAIKIRVTASFTEGKPVRGTLYTNSAPKFCLSPDVSIIKVGQSTKVKIIPNENGYKSDFSKINPKDMTWSGNTSAATIKPASNKQTATVTGTKETGTNADGTRQKTCFYLTVGTEKHGVKIQVNKK